MKGVLRKLQAKFLAGLLVTVPVIVTLLALRFLFRTLDSILGPLVGRLVGHQVPGLGLAATALVVFLAGLLATNYLGRKLITLGEKLFVSLPLVRKIYNASKEIVQAVTFPNRQLFKEVVMIEYPRKGLYVYGFVTSYTTRETPEGDERVANVFIASIPLPTTGLLIAVPVKDLIYLDLPIEEALKIIVSGGIVAPKRLSRRKHREAGTPVFNEVEGSESG